MTTTDTQTNEAAEAALLESCGIVAPVIPTLDPTHRAAFFESAPEGTIVEFYNEVYLRTLRGDWLHLEDLVSAGGYSEYQEHDRSTPKYLTDSLTGDYTVIRVLRVGNGPSY